MANLHGKRKKRILLNESELHEQIDHHRVGWFEISVALLQVTFLRFLFLLLFVRVYLYLALLTGFLTSILYNVKASLT